MSVKEKFNEATRVQMPALVHLNRLGYEYFGKITENMANKEYDPETNILINVFKKQFKKLNPGHEGEAEETLREISLELNNDDLGRSFYKRLVRISPTKLIDFENINNNTFHYTAEFTYKNGDDEFRPDITLFINGLPLVFIEVKKPNNKEGMIAESERMNKRRFPNRKFRRFINITQLMIFSNNMEYDTLGGIVPIQGAFYCTGAREKTKFSCFREENNTNDVIAPFLKAYPYRDIDKDVEKKILSDFNCQVIHKATEYQTNLNVNTPTNRIITSMCSKERLLFLIKYGIAYVKNEREVDGQIESTDQKHIMRYQQLFAALAVREKISEGLKSGVIWHTQGSGKTALSFYLTYVLKDYFAKHNQVVKFYFIVDRLDLLEQASGEFEARGLQVKTASTREELMAQFRTNKSLEGSSGQAEITVVNIQRFAADHKKVDLSEYATNLQRVFIIDEAHRGYNPKGSFLANLFDADPNSIKIALTGTPLLKEERASWKVFGNYIHTYYYDKSIEDGYTLKIIREDIETSYRERLTEIYENVEQLVLKKDIKKEMIVEHPSYVKELLRYIITDLTKFKISRGDDTLGGMVICETSEQARQLFLYFDDVQRELNKSSSIKYNLRAGIILHDSDDKETRKQVIKDFKKNMTVDILFVFNMLLTGFDANRLKRLYFGRKLKDHNLLQALTRVNRPYGDNRYGFIIDFADIKRNFRETNEAYLRELSRFNDSEETGEGNEVDTLSQIIEDPDELIRQMKEARQVLFPFTTDNAEEFSAEVSEIEDKQELLKLKKVLVSARDCSNIVKTFGDDELKEAFEKLEISKLPLMISEVQRCIDIINQKEAFEGDDETRRIVNEAMQDIEFKFQSLGEEELEIISGGQQLQEKWRKTIQSFSENIDHDDPEYITLREAFMERFKEHGFVIASIEDFNEQTRALDEILKKLDKIKKINTMLLKKYNGDAKFVRVHKRIREENKNRTLNKKKPMVGEFEEDIVSVLVSIKNDIDQKVYDRNDILKQDIYFERTVMTEITNGMKKLELKTEREGRVFIQHRISKQYIEQYESLYAS